MTPFEYFVVTCWALSCIVFYLYENKVKKKLKKRYKRKLKKLKHKKKTWGHIE